jgi:hypothetical protein
MRRLQCKRYLFLGILTAVFCYLFCFRYGVFGSKVDWISQHSVLPDYFRQQFYETGELFPEFAANIGGGQNIYNFAYYGLYNPILMLSYLLPSVKMSDYMMAVQFLSLLSSVLLMYAWLGRRGFPQRIRAGVTVMFLLSGPMIYHSYSQVMFVNYMPFLITGLWGADRYFECEEACTGGLVMTHGSRIHGGRYAGNVRRRSGIWIAASVCLMIMTSFYFSIGGMLVLVLYGIHRFLAVCEEEGYSWNIPDGGDQIRSSVYIGGADEFCLAGADGAYTDRTGRGECRAQYCRAVDTGGVCVQILLFNARDRTYHPCPYGPACHTLPDDSPPAPEAPCIAGDPK